MKRYLILTLTAIVLLSIAVEPVLAQMGIGGSDMVGKDGTGTGTENKSLGIGGSNMMGEGRATQMMEQGRGMRAGQGMYGMGFMHSAGDAYGEYVTFTIDSQTGAILNYGIAGTTLFNMSIENFGPISNRSRGSVTWVSNNDSSILIQLHDNPAAVINILAKKSISITFDLAAGVNATKEDNLVRIESGSVTGYIAGGNITSSVSGTQVKVDAPSNSAVVFRAAPVNMPMFDHLYGRFSQEIARNRMGMEIAIGRNSSYDAINYSENMQLMVRAMERDRISLQVNATEPSGRIIAINLDNTSLVIGTREKLGIRYDNQTLQCSDNPDDVFNGTNQPLCWISTIQEGVRAQLMVYIPKFSEHTIDIVVEPAAETPAASPTANATITTAATTKAPGFELLLSLAALLTWVLIVRRRKNN